MDETRTAGSTWTVQHVLQQYNARRAGRNCHIREPILNCRYIAVTQPIKYAKHKNNRRVWLTILLVWAISAAIGSPIVLGLNNTPDRIPDQCMFYNTDFIIYSSLSSFYIPCIIMVFLYYNIFKVRAMWFSFSCGRVNTPLYEPISFARLKSTERRMINLPIGVLTSRSFSFSDPINKI